LSNYIRQIRGVRAKIPAATSEAPVLGQAALGLHKPEMQNADNSNCCCDLNFFSEYFRIE